MRVTKNQIIQGVVDYLHTDIIPKMADGKALQIILTVGANAVAANNRLADALFGNEIVRAMLQDDGSGTYEIGSIADSLRSAVSQYGSFPITIPAIPLIAPHEMTLKLNADDIDAMRQRIEGDRPEE